MKENNTGYTGLEIAVIGMAGRFPGAGNISQYWENLKQGVESICFFPDEELRKEGINPQLLSLPNYVKARGFLKDIEYFDAAFFGYTPAEAVLMDPQVRAMLECAWEALEDAAVDPDTFKGSIGVYVGASDNMGWRFWLALTGMESNMKFSDSLLVTPNLFATRLSYQLNLTGPSTTINSACSTSLVAIHKACRELLGGECDIALAGGVSITVPQKIGYFYEEGMIESRDGHCRAFDSQASGTVFGSGAAIVILKRLDDAFADGNHIHAVIKGSAVNNDGRRKVGYTAPSVEGQSEVIRSALQVAEIDPDTIGYIETHGTGTALGDSIEIKALTRAMNRDKTNPCILGAVKTNIGHLDAASGAAGFIKAVLCIKNRYIPPTIHFITPNPSLGLEDTPFIVSNRLVPWERKGDQPLRAGVSSFGIGGTNAHLILEEAPAVPASPAQTGPGSNLDPHQLLVISARSSDALENATARLADYLKTNNNANIRDVAYTLQAGRKAFVHRRAVVSDSVEQAIDLLSQCDPASVQTMLAGEEYPHTVLMLAGQGSQYVDMGRQLYENLWFFRREMDRCFEILKPLMGFDLREIIYPGIGGTPAVLLSTAAAGTKEKEDAAGRLNRTDIAQPLIFAFEYALARLIMEWGIKPDVMIGYSFGEYVAACLSGVFSLEDGLKLVVQRGRIMQQLPIGGMLSVPLPEEELLPLLGHDLAIAIVNEPSCIVAGTEEALARLEAELKQRRIMGMRLKTNFAAHTAMMDDAVHTFEQSMSTVKLDKPRMPYISGVTGEWIKDEEAADPRYWIKHLKETIRFSRGILNILKERPEPGLFIEIGPGRDLAVLVKRYTDESKNKKQVINLVRPEGKEVSDTRYLMRQIGRLWMFRQKIDWKAIHRSPGKTGNHPRLLSLPTYPFEKKRYWVDLDIKQAMNQPPAVEEMWNRLGRKSDLSEWTYLPSWKRSERRGKKTAGGLCVLFVRQYPGMPADSLGTLLEEKGFSVVKIIPGDRFEKQNEHYYTIDPHVPDHYDRLLEDLASKKSIKQGPSDYWFIHAWNAGDPGKTGIEKQEHRILHEDDVEEAQHYGFYSLMALAQALGKEKHPAGRQTRLLMVSLRMQTVMGEPVSNPAPAPVLGVIRVMRREYPHISCRSVDFDAIDPVSTASIAREMEIMAGEKINDIHMGEETVAYRKGIRWVGTFEQVLLEKPTEEEKKSLEILKPRGNSVYLIIGGLGGLGLEVAQYLASEGSAHLILTGKTPGKAVSPAIKEKIRQMEQKGGKVTVQTLDAADSTQMDALLSGIARQFGHLDGVFFCAGSTDTGGMIQGRRDKKKQEITQAVFSPKARGPVILDRLLQEKGIIPRFIVLFSSMASFGGPYGEVAYAAANAFLDSYCHYRPEQEIDTPRPRLICINWSGWQQVGMAVEAVKRMNENPGEILKDEITPAEGIDVLERILAAPYPHVFVSPRDLHEMCRIGSAEKRDVPQTPPVSSPQGTAGPQFHPRPELDTPYTHPSTDTQLKLANIWQDFFGLDKVGIDDDFFDLGGDSLKAMAAAVHIERTFEIDITVVDFFKYCTIRNIADYIGEKTASGKKHGYTRIPPVEEKEYYPLSPAQKRLYILQQMDPDNIVYNETTVVPLGEGEIDYKKMEEVFRALVERHESLRTSFHIVNGEPVQRIHPHVPFEIHFFDRFDQIKDFVKPFDLAQPPLIRAAVIRMKQNPDTNPGETGKTGEENRENTLLVVDIHHIITDGRSQEIFTNEFIGYYSGQVLPHFQVQYKDYAEWRNSTAIKEVEKEQEAFWLMEFSGELPRLELPLDYNRPLIQGFEGDVSYSRLSPGQLQGLRELGHRFDVTMFMLLMAGFDVLLSRLSGQEDIIVGTVISGRENVDLQPLIGMFANTLALRNFPASDKPFADFLKEVKQRSLEAFENQDYPFEDLVARIEVNRDTSRNPLFDALFTYQSVSASPQEGDYNSGISRFDLLLTAVEAPDDIMLKWNYCRRLFKPETIKRFERCFSQVIDGILENPTKQIGQITIISEEEKARILSEFNNTAADYPADRCVHHLFEAQAQQTPDAVAVSMASNQVTYRQLNDSAGRLADVLRSKGIHTDSIVGVQLERSLEMITGILAILKAGGAYMPIDPSYPRDRIEFMLEDSSANILVTTGTLKEKHQFGSFKGEFILLDSFDFADSITPPPSTSDEQPSTSLAYVIYTSGSTGRPKGVMVEHVNVVRLVKNTDYVHFNQVDRLLQTGALEFDASTFETWGSLVNGLALFLSQKDDILNASMLKKMIRRYDIDIIWLTAPLFNYLSGMDIEIFDGLKYLLVGGDALSPRHINPVKRRFTRLNIVNGYGPTENTTFSTTFLIDKEYSNNIPIGKPIANSTAYIVDRWGQSVPVGIVGELIVGGDGVARGYLNNPELSAEKFSRGSFCKNRPWTPQKLLFNSSQVDTTNIESFGKVKETLSRKGFFESFYRTGDLARWLSDGNIEFLGRVDQQVKIRGFRIEPGEIEHRLMIHNDIKEAVVAVKADESTGDKILCAYVVLKEKDNDAGLPGLKEYLSGVLPPYMVPSYFVRLDEIPLTPNGKVDKRRLPEPTIEGKTGHDSPRTALEEKLTAIWQEVLGTPAPMGIDDDFFDLGGHSLKATLMVSMVQKELKVKITLADVFLRRTVREIAEYIGEASKVKYEDIQPAEKRDYYPLSSAQKRLYVLQQMDPGSTGYNMPFTLPLGENPRIDRLEQAFKVILQRHEILRTSFIIIDEQPFQKIHDDVDFKIQQFEASEVTGIDRIVKAFRQPFDFSRVPLLRAGLLKIRGTDAGVSYILLVDMHHIATDGTSQDILTREFEILTRGGEGEELPPLRLQYKDFSQWQNSSQFKEIVAMQREFWKKEFADELPVLNLPWDFPRPLIQGYEGNTVNFALTPQETSILKDTASTGDVTLYMCMLAVFNVMYSLLSGQEDIILGTPIAARRHVDLQKIIGMLVNTLAMRNYPAGHKIFVDFLKEVKQRTLEAYENQEYHFEDMVDEISLRRDTSRNPIFDAMFNLLNQSDQPFTGAGIPDTPPYYHQEGSSRFDMAWSAVDHGEIVSFTVEYSTRLFKPSTLDKFIAYYKKIIAQLPTHSRGPICGFELLSPEEKKSILDFSNGIEDESFEWKPIHVLFENKALQNPDHVASVFEENHLSYGELNRRSDRLAHVLKKRGTRRDSIVGLMIERSLDMIAGLLAILKAGAGYLPLDPEYPEHRIIDMLKDSGAPVVLSRKSVLNRFSIVSFKDMKPREDHLVITSPRGQVKPFDTLPIPDRTLIDYRKYHRYIGEAPTKNSITVQATRGCPYNCLYCHKIWPKTHEARSAESVFTEISYAYDAGLRRFVFIDDIFNLDRKNSSRLLEKITRSDKKIQLFFPNGFRADILDKDFIDLMMEAGTVNLDVALESASPRIQKLIRKNLNLDKFRENVQYICEKYPYVVLEVEMMHGFPTETEAEAEMTLEFLKQFKWVHFPNLHILKIFPNTDICRLAVEHGISEELIERSANLAFHELPDTLPFPKSFSRQFQARFMGEYFLSKERLLHVLPHQMKILSEDELVQKYDSYLSSEVKEFDDILNYAGIRREELGDVQLRKDKDILEVPDFNKKIQQYFPVYTPITKAFKVLLLDLSQLFTEEHETMLHHQIEEPLGLLYLMSYLNDRFKEQISGKVFKSRIDFDSYDELKKIIFDFKPHLIGIRTLSFYKEFFHKAALMIRQWGIDVPIVAGGPYATSDFKLILQDSNVDLVVLGEGEHTLGEIARHMIENNNRLPNNETLAQIKGIAYIDDKEQFKREHTEYGREFLVVDELPLHTIEIETAHETIAVEEENQPGDLVYVIYTSGSTGKPKGVMLEHRSLVNLIQYQYKYTSIDFSRVLQFTTISFDVSAQEILSTLLAGGRLTLVKKETVGDVMELLKVIEKENIKTLFMPASYLKFIMSEEDYIDAISPGVRHIVTAGEQVVVSERFRAFLKENRVYLHNHYGPSESHVVTALTLDPTGSIPELPSIGKPLTHTGIYILDKGMHLTPVGVAGELIIGGIQVGRGYLNHPELSAERFLIHGLHRLNGLEEKGDRQENFQKLLLNLNKSFYGVQGRFLQKEPLALYRTGDLARWLPEGNIEFMGRIDQQLKIRGFRIEPGEIENQLLTLDMIKEAVVIAREEASGGKYLCAYVVSPGEIDMTRLRETLSGRLPDYMIPSYFVQVEKIPLTPNRKIDRRALPDPEMKRTGSISNPENVDQEKLRDTWAEILDMDKVMIGIDDNFFELGGHSLKATILTHKMHKVFDVKIPLLEVFKSPTIRKLVLYIKEAKHDVFVSINPTEERDYYPMSSAQKRLFVLQQMEKDLTVYNLPFFTQIDESIETKTLEDVFNKLIHRHQTLRTSFHMMGEQPVQVVHPHVGFSLQYYSLDIPEGVEEEHRSHKINAIIRTFVKPFDLSQAPLLRAGLTRAGEKANLLMMDIHHIVTDGVSQGLIFNDFMRLVRGESLKPLRIQYKDYTMWQQGDFHKNKVKQQEEFWLSRFTDEIPVLNLSTDFPRPVVQGFEGSVVRSYFDQEVTRRIDELAAKYDATLFMTLLSFYTILLSKLSGQEDIVVGTPSAGRDHTDLQPIVGMFVNTLALRNFTSGDQTAEDFIIDVRDRTLDAFDNQEYLFEDLVEHVKVERDTGRNPLFDVMLSLQNMGLPGTTDAAPIAGAGSSSRVPDRPGLIDFEMGVSRFDITLSCSENNGELEFMWEYCTRLFKKETIIGFDRFFKVVVDSILEEPTRLTRDIEIISDEDREMILNKFNATAADFPSDKTIIEMFRDRVNQAPDAAAICGNTLQPAEFLFITYRFLDVLSGNLAVKLKEKGIRPGTIAAIMMDRSIEMMVGIFGILRAGGAYLPIDPAYPQDRIDFMLKDSGAKIILGREAARSVSTPSPSHNDPAFSPAIPSDAAYVIYTSGSTGKPKGVLVEHRSVVNRLNWMQKAYAIGNRDRILQKTPVVFDVSVWELFWWSFQGASLCLLGVGEEKNPEGIVQTIAAQGITAMHFVPSMLTAFLEYISQDPIKNTLLLNSLRQVFSSGEALLSKQVQRFLLLLGDTGKTRLINLYGPTEATVDVSYFNCDFSAESVPERIPIGKPIDNIQLVVLDRYMKFQPVGTAGELYIGGVGLARGYINRPELTRGSFVKPPLDPAKLLLKGDFYSDPDNIDSSIVNNKNSNKSFWSHLFTKRWAAGGSLYRTGDLARWIPDGNIEYLGRVDFQVKIRGFRIELGEIEAALLRHEEVRESVVVIRSDGGGDNQLCAYVVPRQSYTEETIRELKLKEYLSDLLPSYMIPTWIVPLEEMPLTTTGKVDRKALPQPKAGLGTEYVEPRTDTEKTLARIWADILVLEQRQVGIDSRFFDLGGHSIKATVLAGRIHRELQVKVTLANIFQYSTIRQLAKHIDKQTREVFMSITPAEQKNHYPVSAAQKRMYITHQMNPQGTDYNMIQTILLKGDLNPDRLEYAFKRLVQRHESFRTGFEMRDNSPVQVIYPRVEFNVEYIETDSDAYFDEEKHELVFPGSFKVDEARDRFVRAFDLSSPPLLRIGVVTTRSNLYVLMVDTHHIISDGISNSIIVEEFIRFYKGEESKPLKLQYKDFSEWQNRLFAQGEIKKQENYWLGVYHDGVPSLDFPVDYPRPAVHDSGSDTVYFAVDPGLTSKIKEINTRTDTTPYMVLMSIFSLALYRNSGKNSNVIGSATAGRRHDDLKGIVGMFINILSIRNTIDEQMSYSEFLEHVKQNSLDAYENQDYQFDELVNRLKIKARYGRNPLFDAHFTFQNAADFLGKRENEYIPGLSILPLRRVEASLSLDLNLLASDNPPVITLALDYLSSIFKRNTIEKFSDHFLEILSQCMENPQIKLADIVLSSAQTAAESALTEEEVSGFDF